MLFGHACPDRERVLHRLQTNFDIPKPHPLLHQSTQMSSAGKLKRRLEGRVEKTGDRPKKWVFAGVVIPRTREETVIPRDSSKPASSPDDDDAELSNAFQRNSSERTDSTTHLAGTMREGGVVKREDGVNVEDGDTRMEDMGVKVKVKIRGERVKVNIQVEGARGVKVAVKVSGEAMKTREARVKAEEAKTEAV